MFNVDEMTIIGFYRTDTIANLLEDIEEVLPYVTDDMAVTTLEGIKEKLSKLSDDELKLVINSKGFAAAGYTYSKNKEEIKWNS